MPVLFSEQVWRPTRKLSEITNPPDYRQLDEEWRNCSHLRPSWDGSEWMGFGNVAFSVDLMG